MKLLLKHIILIAILLLISIHGCGQWDGGSTDHKIDCLDGCTDLENRTSHAKENGTSGKDGISCTLSQTTSSTAEIACGDNTFVIKNGKDGAAGSDGQDGKAGTDGKDGTDGQNGTNGINGAVGAPGQDGYSVVFNSFSTAPTCSNGGYTLMVAVDSNRNHVFDSGDSNIQSTEICNGQNGQDAPPTQFTPVTVIDPCGDAPGIYDEVFLRFANGQLLWSLSDSASGLNTRFSLAVPGNWQTTDGSHCYFTIDSGLNVINQHY